MARSFLVLGPVAALAACSHPPPPPLPALVAETSHYAQTGGPDEPGALCAAFPRSFPGRARCDVIGTSAGGLPLHALTVSTSGALTPAAARARQLPVLLVQAGIHAGEIEGKDAGFALLRDVLVGTLDPHLLDHVVVVFIPVVNVDGDHRRSRHNRPNQVGPDEMGWRTNGANLNLNRDYVKLDSPELTAITAAFTAWDPTVYVDLHTTDGAKFQHDVAVLVTPKSPRPDGLDETARALSDELQAQLTTKGHRPVAFYPSFNQDDDPSSGFSDGDPPPRFSHAYAPARGRLGILVETHSWRTYRERLQSDYDTLAILLAQAAAHGRDWRQVEREADGAAARLGGQQVVLAFKTTDKTRPIEFLGYRYHKEHSDVSGADWLRYDDAQPETWTVPMSDELAPALTVTAPRGGYIVDGGFGAALAPRLRAHGVRFTQLGATPARELQVWKAETHALHAESYEGRQRLDVTGGWEAATRPTLPGAIYVPIDQPAARLVLELFEPLAADSLAGWGFFNAAFEQKEYMEAYVAEQVARELLAADPALAAEFQQKLASDPAFAASPQARLDFFYRHAPSWDDHRDLLPVYRVDHSIADDSRNTSTH